MMKKLTNRISLLLVAIALLLSLAPSASAALGTERLLGDITTETPYYADIQALNKLGALEGLISADGRFGPDRTCTRNTFVQIMQNLFSDQITVTEQQIGPAELTQREATALLQTYSKELGYEVEWTGATADLISRAQACHYINGMLACEPKLAAKVGKNDNGGQEPSPKPSNPNPPTEEPQPSPSQRFSDVHPDSYYAAAVDWAVENRVTQGTSKTTFSPNKDCTVAQVLTFLYRANGSPEIRKNVGCPFPTVVEGNFAYDALRWAGQNKLITDDSIDPEAAICTRAFLVSCLWKLAGSPAVSSNTYRHFTDVVSGSSYAAAVGWAVKNGITNGSSPDTFSPMDTVNRAQAVTFLYRAYSK